MLRLPINFYGWGTFRLKILTFGRFFYLSLANMSRLLTLALFSLSFLGFQLPNATGQKSQVRGIVLDETTRLPLEGAIVSIAGIVQTSVTDIKGRFILV